MFLKVYLLIISVFLAQVVVSQGIGEEFTEPYELNPSLLQLVNFNSSPKSQMVTIEYHSPNFSSNISTSDSNRFRKFPESRFRIDMGGYLVVINSSVQLGLKAMGGGLIIDTEQALGLKSDQNVAYADFAVDLGKTYRHQLKIGFLFNRRSAFKKITEDITIGDIFLPAETVVETTFNFDVYNLEYLYSVVKDRRSEVKIGAGIFVMPVIFETVVKSPGLNVNKRAEATITAPLPVVELEVNIALTPRLFLNQELALMYLSLENFSGEITNFELDIMYQLSKNIDVGMGWHTFDLNIGADRSSWPGVDMVGQIGLGYSGPFMYGSICF